MRKVDGAMRQANGVSFWQATPPQRLAVCSPRSTASRNARWTSREGAMDARERRRPSNMPAPAHYFRMMKELALLGYFTSEVGCTQALRYVETPGRFDPCIPYTPGEPAWADARLKLPETL